MVSLPDAIDCIYTACFCEENVWQLCRKIETEYPEFLTDCFAVFISNPIRAVPLWNQKAGKDDEGMDYHVIFIVKSADSSYMVYDLDSRLLFPELFSRYVQEIIRNDEHIIPQYNRFFRVIPAKLYLQTFASDRRHMKADDRWIKEPPTYPPIFTQENVHNIDCFIDMTVGNGYGDVLCLQQFVKRFTESNVSEY